MYLGFQVVVWYVFRWFIEQTRFVFKLKSLNILILYAKWKYLHELQVST